MDGPDATVIIQAIGLGCYMDDPNNRILNEQVWKDQSDMTKTWCANNCTRLQYPLFGVEYGRECKNPFFFHQAHLRGPLHSADQARFLWTQA